MLVDTMVLDRSLDCPQCGAEFEQREEHDVTIDYCPDCGGVWLDPGELEELTGAKHHKHGHSHSDHDIDVDLDDEEEYEEEEEEGLLGAVTSALGGGEEEEWEDEEGWEEEEEWGGEEEFGGGEEEI
jgi:Zn-finger nucleic acid-binding protein